MGKPRISCMDPATPTDKAMMAGGAASMGRDLRLRKRQC
jgi:hypothetical protein